MRNLNLNQFALPGMEGLAHPGARHLAQGIMFHGETEKQSYPGSEREGGYLKATQNMHHVHRLYAHNMGGQFDPERHHGNALGWMEWGGKEHSQAQYPGEIQMVERGYGTQRTKGLMTDLYRIGHEMNFGQTTVPVHSPTRSAEGEAWSKKVGGPRPRQNDYGWQPPEGIHPYEQAEAAEGIARRRRQEGSSVKGQQRLF